MTKERTSERSFAWSESVETPAYVFDETLLVSHLETLRQLAQTAGLKVLYSMKAAARFELLEIIQPRIDGFSTSSLFETRLIKSLRRDGQLIHLVSPGLRAAEVRELTGSACRVSFNSLEQLHRLRSACGDSVGIGLRVNPGISLVDDARYDACRQHSKLGVPLAHLAEVCRQSPEVWADIDGLHVHTNCEAKSYDGLLVTVQRLIEELPDLVAKVSWVNLGGGYLFADINEPSPLLLAANLLRSQGCEVSMEPGAGIVQKCGYLVSSVVDLFERDGREVAVLDTTVGHWPEILEYQFEPNVLGDLEHGRFEYTLAGASCLAGDIFGNYALDEPLSVGSRVVFREAGAYSLVKASYFNGINLPSTYLLKKSGALSRSQRFSYDDFLARNGVLDHVFV